MSLPHLVLIHGANASGPEMEPLAAVLRPYAQVHAPNLPGHGGREVPERLSMGQMAADVIAGMDRGRLERAFLVGYSLGGTLALYLARHNPRRVLGVCALAAKYIFDTATVTHWTYLVSLERLRRPGNARPAQLERAHAPQDWTAVAKANARFFEDLGREPPLDDADLAAIACPVQLVNANRDRVVPWAETLAMGQRIPGAKLVMFYGLAHPLSNVPVHRLGRTIGAWMKESMA